MVVQVLVAERQREDSLRKQVADVVLDAPRVAVVVEAVGELLDDRAPAFDFPQQQHTGIRRDVAAVEVRADLTPA